MLVTVRVMEWPGFGYTYSQVHIKFHVRVRATVSSSVRTVLGKWLGYA